MNNGYTFQKILFYPDEASFMYYVTFEQIVYLGG